jgi:uncharacterized repeat protein (TIGR04042 family)
MPEMRFRIRWPDGAAEICYSPSLVVKEHLTPGESYSIEDFRARCCTALTIASQRVKEKYGYPCGLALGQLDRLERACAEFATDGEAKVCVEAFEE